MVLYHYFTWSIQVKHLKNTTMNYRVSKKKVSRVIPTPNFTVGRYDYGNLVFKITNRKFKFVIGPVRLFYL